MTSPESIPDFVRASGSYRDPEGFVFFQGDRVFRALTKDGLASYHDFRQSPLSQWLEEENWVTRTWETDSASAGALVAKFPEVTGIIEQSRIPFIRRNSLSVMVLRNIPGMALCQICLTSETESVNPVLGKTRHLSATS